MSKITHKAICLLLTLVMLLGVMPLAGIGTFRAKAADAGSTAAGETVVKAAAADDADTAPAPRRAAAEPTWVEVGREKKHEDRMKKLITLLTSPHEYHIKLVGHIDISDKNDLPIWGKTRGIQIKGVKHLDMNGYNISYEHTGVGYSKKFVYKDAVNDNAKYLYYLMTVTEDASFYLYNSTGKNGKIFFGQPMYVSEMPYRNILSVKGRFTMYGGEISTGASKKLYYTDVRTVNYYGEDKHTFSYTGNLRLQLQGSGVTVEDGGYFELNGGDVYGRGPHFAAIEGRRGSTVVINDGYIEGAGGADVYSGGYKRRAWEGWRTLRRADALEHGKLTVNGGRFKARVIDVELVHHEHPDDKYGAYKNMKPGKVYVIVDNRNPDTYFDMDWFIEDDVVYYSGVKVTPPTDGVSKPSKRITLESAPGYDTTYYHPNDAFVINVGYQSYWGKYASALENDYNPNSWCRLFYMFYLYKVGESTPIAEYYSESPRLNLRDLRDSKTNAWPRYEIGAKYYIRVLVTEAWNNRYHTVYEGIQDWYFTATDFESRMIDFDYKVTISDKAHDRRTHGL